MRIEIKTNGPVLDRDIKALWILCYALHVQSTPRMRVANLQFVADQLGYRLVPKNSL
jgi:hypothetical protein